MFWYATRGCAGVGALVQAQHTLLHVKPRHGGSVTEGVSTRLVVRQRTSDVEDLKRPPAVDALPQRVQLQHILRVDATVPYGGRQALA